MRAKPKHFSVFDRVFSTGLNRAMQTANPANHAKNQSLRNPSRFASLAYLAVNNPDSLSSVFSAPPQIFLFQRTILPTLVIPCKLGTCKIVLGEKPYKAGSY